MLCLYELTNVEHLGHFTVRGTEESTLPRVPQPRLDLNTENGTTPRISQELSSFGAVLNFNWQESCRNSRGDHNFFGGFLADLLVISRTKLLF